MKKKKYYVHALNCSLDDGKFHDKSSFIDNIKYDLLLYTCVSPSMLTIRLAMEDVLVIIIISFTLSPTFCRHFAASLTQSQVTTI